MWLIHRNRLLEYDVKHFIVTVHFYLIQRRWHEQINQTYPTSTLISFKKYSPGVIRFETNVYVMYLLMFTDRKITRLSIKPAWQTRNLV